MAQPGVLVGVLLSRDLEECLELEQQGGGPELIVRQVLRPGPAELQRERRGSLVARVVEIALRVGQGSAILRADDTQTRRHDPCTGRRS